jgi:hypothetical protein
MTAFTRVLQGPVRAEKEIFPPRKIFSHLPSIQFC